MVATTQGLLPPTNDLLMVATTQGLLPPTNNLLMVATTEALLPPTKDLLMVATTVLLPPTKDLLMVAATAEVDLDSVCPPTQISPPGCHRGRTTLSTNRLLAVATTAELELVHSPPSIC